MNIKVVSLILLIILATISGIYFFSKDMGLLPQPVKSTSLKPHPLEVYAWYPDYDEKNALVSLQNAKINQVSPFWYMIDKSGNLTVDESETKEDAQAVSKKRDIAVLPSIVNEFDGERVHKLLIAQNKWSDFAKQLLILAHDEDYQGYDLDLEELYASDRDTFTAFVTYLASQLHEKDLLLSVTVHAQTGDEDPRDAEIAQDLAGLSESADQIRIMAYDFHHADGEPGPVTPLSDLANVLAQTKKLVPTDKVVIALPTYGYDWSPTQGADLQYADAISLINKNAIAYHLDEKEQALTGTYTGTDGHHTIWFENSQTLKAKVAMVKEAGFYKIALWRLGGEDPTTWNIF